MQNELDAESTAVPIHILAVNAAGQESANDLAVADRDLPLLQDTAQDDVWGSWGVAWRDVIVLDRDNVPIYTVNLTTYDLGDASNFAALKQVLRDAAQ
ncbi:MAG: hypothetical protein EP329_12955 [Deltaproteobacteria bacterium]|nr:MAG: hypothetical protein EP329_12955 [Deltaproteobacteria bacterium]